MKTIRLFLLPLALFALVSCGDPSNTPKVAPTPTPTPAPTTAPAPTSASPSTEFVEVGFVYISGLPRLKREDGNYVFRNETDWAAFGVDDSGATVSMPYVDFNQVIVVGIASTSSNGCGTGSKLISKVLQNNTSSVVKYKTVAPSGNLCTQEVVDVNAFVTIPKQSATGDVSFVAE
jgi:hypothetical protein